MVKYIVLGATGSIGTQTLDIIKEEKSELVAFSYGSNTIKAIEIIKNFNPKYVGVKEEQEAKKLKELFPNLIVYFGENASCEVARLLPGDSVVVNALVGSAGLLPTINAIETSHNVLLANKETLVIGGEIVMKKAAEYNVNIIPIDSEHSAIYQLLVGHNKEEVKQIVITASGGPFRTKKKEELVNVTLEDALKHPNWVMGKKITIDSATLMNKGFEVIEAKHLFNLELSKIKTIIHPESIIHSMVEFNDNSIFAQLGSSDMHLAINYAMNGPIHKSNSMIEPLDLTKLSGLHFEKLDLAKYTLVGLAYNALEKGGIYPTILNASNEVAVELFLNGKIGFVDIEKIILEEYNNPRYIEDNKDELTIEKILLLDKKIKEKIKNIYNM